MAEQMRPASPEQAPDPSNNYERSHPEREAGMGRLENNKATPENHSDAQEGAVSNRQVPGRQINADESAANRGAERAMGNPAPEQPDHSMHDEEPTGWDQAPTDIRDPEQKRHPRTEGRGGTP